MISNINGGILATLFVAAAALTIAAATSRAPAIAQDGNMTGGGNVTEGNMTAPDTGGGGMAATPPTMTP
jgi:hypothetical protein